MKKLLFLLICFLATPIFVKGASNLYWYENIYKNTTYLEVYQFTGTTSFTNKNPAADNYDTGNVKIPIYYSNAIASNSNGIGFLPLVHIKLDNDYMYSMSQYICTSNPNSFSSVVLTSGSSTSTAISTTMKYHQTSIFELNVPFTLTSIDPLFSNMKKCYQITSIFAPSVSGNYTLLRIKGSSSANYDWVYLGYDLESLSIYTDSVKQIVDNAIASSGFASANSVQQVQDSVNAMKDQLAKDADDINQSIMDTNSKLDEMNDTLTNSNIDGADSSASEWADKSLSDNVVADMVTMPITLLQAYLNGFNGTCKTFNLGSLMGSDLSLPCINLQNYFGATLWSVIDILFSGFMIFALGKKFVKIFNDFTNLKDTQVNELYGGGN